MACLCLGCCGGYTPGPLEVFPTWVTVSDWEGGVLLTLELTFFEILGRSVCIVPRWCSEATCVVSSSPGAVSPPLSVLLPAGISASLVSRQTKGKQPGVHGLCFVRLCLPLIWQEQCWRVRGCSGVSCTRAMECAISRLRRSVLDRFEY